MLNNKMVFKPFAGICRACGHDGAVAKSLVSGFAWYWVRISVLALTQSWGFSPLTTNKKY